MSVSGRTMRLDPRNARSLARTAFWSTAERHAFSVRGLPEGSVPARRCSFAPCGHTWPSAVIHGIRAVVASSALRRSPLSRLWYSERAVAARRIDRLFDRYDNILSAPLKAQ